MAMVPNGTSVDRNSLTPEVSATRPHAIDIANRSRAQSDVQKMGMFGVSMSPPRNRCDTGGSNVTLQNEPAPQMRQDLRMVQSYTSQVSGPYDSFVDCSESAMLTENNGLGSPTVAGMPFNGSDGIFNANAISQARSHQAGLTSSKSASTPGSPPADSGLTAPGAHSQLAQSSTSTLGPSTSSTSVPSQMLKAPSTLFNTVGSAVAGLFQDGRPNATGANDSVPFVQRAHRLVSGLGGAYTQFGSQHSHVGTELEPLGEHGGNSNEATRVYSGAPFGSNGPDNNDVHRADFMMYANHNPAMNHNPEDASPLNIRRASMNEYGITNGMTSSITISDPTHVDMAPKGNHDFWQDPERDYLALFNEGTPSSTLNRKMILKASYIQQLEFLFTPPDPTRRRDVGSTPKSNLTASSSFDKFYPPENSDQFIDVSDPSHKASVIHGQREQERREYCKQKVEYCVKSVIPTVEIDRQTKTKIGEGGFGHVFKAVRRIPRPVINGQIHTDDSYVAIKEHKECGHLQTKSFEDRLRVLRDIVEEARIHNEHRHENIIKFYGFWVDDEHYQKEISRNAGHDGQHHPNKSISTRDPPPHSFPYPKLTIAIEFAAGGSLHDYFKRFIKENVEYMLEAEPLLKWSKDVVSATAFLHKHHIIHCDIKSHNILLCIDKAKVRGLMGEDQSEADQKYCLELSNDEIDMSESVPDPSVIMLKLTDFGTAKVTDPKTGRVRNMHKQTDHNYSMSINDNKLMGTSAWMAPELFKMSAGEHYSFKSDVWSLGVLLWEILTGRAPYKDVEHIAIGMLVGTKGSQLPIPNNLPEAYQNVLKDCWNMESDERPDAQQILEQIEAVYHDDSAYNHYQTVDMGAYQDYLQNAIDQLNERVQSVETKRQTVEWQSQMLQVREQQFENEKRAYANKRALLETSERKTQAKEQLITLLTTSDRYRRPPGPRPSPRVNSMTTAQPNMEKVRKYRRRIAKEIKRGKMKISGPLNPMHYPGTPDFTSYVFTQPEDHRYTNRYPAYDMYPPGAASMTKSMSSNPESMSKSSSINSANRTGPAIFGSPDSPAIAIPGQLPGQLHRLANLDLNTYVPPMNRAPSSVSSGKRDGIPRAVNYPLPVSLGTSQQLTNPGSPTINQQPGYFQAPLDPLAPEAPASTVSVVKTRSRSPSLTKRGSMRFDPLRDLTQGPPLMTNPHMPSSAVISDIIPRKDSNASTQTAESSRSRPITRTHQDSFGSGDGGRDYRQARLAGTTTNIKNKLDPGTQESYRPRPRGILQPKPIMDIAMTISMRQERENRSRSLDRGSHAGSTNSMDALPDETANISHHSSTAKSKKSVTLNKNARLNQ